MSGPGWGTPRRFCAHGDQHSPAFAGDLHGRFLISRTRHNVTLAHGDQLRPSGVTERSSRSARFQTPPDLAPGTSGTAGTGAHRSAGTDRHVAYFTRYCSSWKHEAQLNIRIPTRPFLEILHAGHVNHAGIHDAIIIHHLLRSKIVSRRSRRPEHWPSPARAPSHREKSAADSAARRSCISFLHCSLAAGPCGPAGRTCDIQHATVITMASSGPPRSHDSPASYVYAASLLAPEYRSGQRPAIRERHAPEGACATAVNTGNKRSGSSPACLLLPNDPLNSPTFYLLDNHGSFQAKAVRGV